MLKKCHKDPISSGILETFFAGLQNCFVEELIINGLQVQTGQDSYWEQLLRMISNPAYTSLRKLCLINTKLQEGIVDKLAPALVSHRDLNHIDLSGNHISDSFIGSLPSALPETRLRTLILQDTNMSSAAIKLLGKIMPCFKAIETLDIRNNKEMNDDGLLSIVKNLQKCEKLTNLMISLNKVKKEGP